MSWRSCLLASLLVCTLATLGEAADKPADQWIAVTAPAFRSALEPLCKRRRAEGFHVEVVQTTDVLTTHEILTGDAEKLRKHVNKLCKEYKGQSYVLLVGAVEAGALPEPENKVLPPLPGTVSRMKGQPSDNGYGCLGAGLEPEVAVGRFPARTAKEAEQMVHKTLAFEEDSKPGEWRRRITVLAGVPAFNPLVDRLAEGLAMSRFDRIAPIWTGRAIYHNAQSRFCVPDDQLHDRAAQLVQEGQAFTLYLGHSSARRLYSPGARFLDRDDWATLRIPRGSGVFATFGCLGCQLKGGDGEGYGVAAMRNPDGPAAVTGSHGSCFAAMVELAAGGLFQAFAATPPERMGDVWLKVKEGLARGKIDALTFRMLDAVDGESNIPLATQRLEHLEMFLLLGDPALHLPVVPTDIQLQVPRTAEPGKQLTVSGDLPKRLAGARLRLTLERTPGSEPVDLEKLPREPAEARTRVMLANQEKANRFVLGTREATVQDGHFELELDVPARAPWPRVIVRAYAVTDGQEGLGVRVIPIQGASK